MDLNMMMREQARMGLQTQLDTAVTNGDTEAARKIAGDIAKLEVQTAPKAPPYGDAEIRAAIGTKADWFGVDPERSAAVIELGKHMSPAKFATAELFADALIKAVEAKFKPAAPPKKAETDEDPPADPEDGEGEGEGEDPPVRKPRRTDGPGEGDMGARSRAPRSGPWTKISDAPRDVQTEIKRTADKFAPKTKEGRAAYETRALEAHYAQHQRTKGKK